MPQDAAFQHQSFRLRGYVEDDDKYANPTELWRPPVRLTTGRLEQLSANLPLQSLFAVDVINTYKYLHLNRRDFSRL